MRSSLSSVANNPSEKTDKIKSKFGHNDKKCKTCGITCKVCNCFLEYTKFKDDLRDYKCLYYNKNYQQKLNKKLKKQFFNTYNFFNHDNNKFILLLRKGVYLYEYIHDWEKSNEKLLPEREDIYSHLNMEDITKIHACKRVCMDFEIKQLGEYHDFYV